LTITSLVHALEQRLEVTLRNKEKTSPQTLPEITLTDCWFVGPEIEALPVMDQE